MTYIPGLLLAILLPMQPGTAVYPLSEVYTAALELLEAGELEAAAGAFAEIMERMPHQGRARYDAAAAIFELGGHAVSDSLVSMGELGVGADSASSAAAAVLLATSIDAEDYAGVEEAYGRLCEIVTGELPPHECDLVNLEVAINWLRNHDPPQDQSEDQQDQAEDQQDQSEDQQDQSEDQQDQSEDQQDQSEDQSEDQQDQSEDQQEEQSPPPPSQGEMTEEDAQRILELVEEAEPPDSDEGAKGYTTSGPVW